MFFKVIAVEQHPWIEMIRQKYEQCRTPDEEVSCINYYLLGLKERNRFEEKYAEVYKYLYELISAYIPPRTIGQRYEVHKNLIGDVSEIEQLIRERVPEALWFLYDAPQRSGYHKEGPTLKHHLQAMLNALKDLERFAKYLPEHYRKLILDHHEFFIWYILLHDIGKGVVLRLKESGKISTGRHAVSSAELMSKVQVPQAIAGTLKNIIRYHESFLELSQDLEGYQLELVESLPHNDETLKLLICALFLNLAWPDAPYFKKDMERISNGIVFWEEFIMQRQALNN